MHGICKAAIAPQAMMQASVHLQVFFDSLSLDQ
jgi:hypothetical protein